MIKLFHTLAPGGQTLDTVQFQATLDKLAGGATSNIQKALSEASAVADVLDIKALNRSPLRPPQRPYCLTQLFRWFSHVFKDTTDQEFRQATYA